MSIRDISTIKTDGDRLVSEVKTHADNSYNDVHSATAAFKNTIDLKYGKIITDMNDRMDKQKNEYKDYSNKYIADLNRMVDSYVEYYMLSRLKAEKHLMKITGKYPMSENINNKSGLDIPRFSEIYLSIPKNNCLAYMNYRDGIVGYDYINNKYIQPRFYDDNLVYGESGITSSKDGRLYYQKIKNEGIWHGVGTENDSIIHNELLLYYGLSSFIDSSKHGPYSGYMGWKSVYANISENDNEKYLWITGKSIFDISDPRYNTVMRSVSVSTLTGTDFLTERIMGAWSRSVVCYDYNKLNKYMAFNNRVRHGFDSSELFTFLINRKRGKEPFENVSYIKELQYESLPICTPYVVKTREQSAISYDNIDKAKSIIIKTNKINPIEDVIEIYQDNNIHIKATKFIKYFFDKDENNTVIINLVSRKLYVNGIDIPKSYWYIVSDSIGVIIDESRNSPELSRKLPIEHISPIGKTIGVVIDETVDSSELIREGDII